MWFFCYCSVILIQCMFGFAMSFRESWWLIVTHCDSKLTYANNLSLRRKIPIAIWYLTFCFWSMFLWLRSDCDRIATFIRVLRNCRLLQPESWHHFFHDFIIEDWLWLRLHLTTIKHDIRVMIIIGLDCDRIATFIRVLRNCRLLQPEWFYNWRLTVIKIAFNRD
jgi:hypothetical protein